MEVKAPTAWRASSGSVKDCWLPGKRKANLSLSGLKLARPGNHFGHWRSKNRSELPFSTSSGTLTILKLSPRFLSSCSASLLQRRPTSLWSDPSSISCFWTWPWNNQAFAAPHSDRRHQPSVKFLWKDDARFAWRDSICSLTNSFSPQTSEPSAPPLSATLPALKVFICFFLPDWAVEDWGGVLFPERSVIPVKLCGWVQQSKP